MTFKFSPGATLTGTHSLSLPNHHMTQPANALENGVFPTTLTTHKTAPERLQLASMVFNGTQDGIVVTDEHRSIVAVNPAFSRITSYTEEEVLGQNIRMLRSRKQELRFYQQIWQEVDNTGTWQGTVWHRRKSGEDYLEWLTLNAVTTETGETRYVGVFSDISQLGQARELQQIAHHDGLTGLPNRLLLKSRLDHSMQRCERLESLGAVMFLDLGDLAVVSDALGQAAGEELLILAARRLQERLRSMDTLARLGGTEFVVVLEEIQSAQSAAQLARNMIERLAEPFLLEGGHSITVDPNIGVALFPGDGHKSRQLLQRADAALALAKTQGPGACCFHSPAVLKNDAEADM